MAAWCWLAELAGACCLLYPAATSGGCCCFGPLRVSLGLQLGRLRKLRRVALYLPLTSKSHYALIIKSLR